MSYIHQDAIYVAQAADRSDARYEALRDADEGGCLSVAALMGLEPEVIHPGHWALECQCCDGSGEHNEVPQRRSVEDTKNWPCQPCAGTGEFRIEIPR